MGLLAISGFVPIVVGVLGAVGWLLASVRGRLTVKRLPPSELTTQSPTDSATDAEGPHHTFTIGHSGFIGHPTPEQQAVLDRLKSGELTPQEAAARLGGKVHQGGLEMHLSLGGGEEEAAEDQVPPPTAAVAKVAAVWRWALPVALSLLVLVGGIVWVRGGLTTRNHLFITAVVSIVAFALLAALGGPSGIQRLTASAQVTSRVGLIGGSSGAVAILAWGIGVTAAGHWSLFVPGVVGIALATGILVAVLLTVEAISRSRGLFDDRGRGHG